MGNGQFQVPKHVNNEWTEIYRSNKKYFKNKITHEQFQLMILPKTPEYQDISHLIERSIYSIPKTPKIIILNVQKGELFILVQEFNLSLAQLLGIIILTIDILELLLETLTVITCLYKKYGEFGISENMIGLNKNMQIMAWINEHKQKNQIQIQLQKTEEPQKIMISQIIAIFKKYFKGFLPIEELKSANNMETLQLKLIKMIKKRKIEMSGNFTELKSNRDYIKRTLSPQKSFVSVRHEVKSPKKDIESVSKIEKRNNIPNFLKRMAQKKIRFLDNLQDKRPVDIGQPKQSFKKQRNLMEIKSPKSQKSLSKSLNKGQSLKVSPNKFTNNNFSGEMSKLSFPTGINTEKTYDFLYQSGSPSNYIIKKRDFLQSKKTKSTKDWKFQSLTPKTAKNNYQSTSPTYTQNQSNYWQANTDSFFHPPLISYPQNIQQDQLETIQKIPVLQVCSNTTMQENLSQPCAKKQQIVQEQKGQSQINLKTLQDEFNQFFSNHSQSPRFMFEALPQSLELKQEFSKIIDF